MTAEERLNYLSKPYWTYKDIMDYFNCKSSKAAEIKKKALDKPYNGSVMYMTGVVHIDAVLKVMGYSLEDEISKCEKIISAKRATA